MCEINSVKRLGYEKAVPHTGSGNNGPSVCVFWPAHPFNLKAGVTIPGIKANTDESKVYLSRVTPFFAISLIKKIAPSFNLQAIFKRRSIIRHKVQKEAACDVLVPICSATLVTRSSMEIMKRRRSSDILNFPAGSV